MDANQAKSGFNDSHSVLFIAERFPPSVGGQQRLNYGLHQQFKGSVRTYLLTPGLYLKFNLQKLWFFPYAILVGSFICARHNVTHIHVSSARLALIGYLVARFFNVKLSAGVHGLDVTLKGKFISYKYLTPHFLRKYDAIICNSSATLEQCARIGLDRDMCHVVYPGVNVEKNCRSLSKQQARKELSKHVNVDLADKVVITTVGRLVRRKGVAWFVDTVFPLLPQHFVYLVVGNGPEEDRIRELLDKNGLASSVYLLGDIPDLMRDLVYDAADLFVMPNITVPGDREGFGIVNIEAGMHDLPVVASGIEGIRDAVVEGVTGRLVREADSQSFIDGIDEVLSWDTASKKISSVVSTRFSWQQSYRSYAEILGLNEKA